MFEVSCTDLTHIAITFEHPSDESMATVELDLTHVNQIACQVYTSSAVPVCPEDLANKVIQKCMSIPITMRSLIRYGQSKLKPVGQEPDTEMSLANNSFFNGGNAEGQYSHGNGGSAPNSGIDSKYGREGHLGVPGSAQPGHEESMETDRGGGANNSTGFGDYIKDEPMDYEHDSGTFKSGAVLNEYGPQDATFNPEASSSSQPKSSNMSLKLKTELGSTAKTESGSGHESMLLPPKMEHIKPEFSLTKPRHPGKAERRESSIPDIKPLVSITPVSSSTCSLSMSKKSAGGIEIIPLGGSNEKDQSREMIRRSLSEDDKRRLEKKSMSSKKRKHLSSSRVSTGMAYHQAKRSFWTEKARSSKSTSDKDRKRSSHGFVLVFSSSSGGKLNKTFQIPKLSKSSSPSTAKESNNRLTPTTSPKQSHLSYSSNSSPKYIGGGSVTPPNISPKHPYSAPSSSGAGSLNEYGPQDATFNPEASSSSQPKSSSSSSTPTTAPTTTTSSALKHKVPSTSSGSSSSNMSLKLKTELGSTAKTESGSGHESMLLPPKMEHIKPEFSLTKASPSSSNDFKGKAERRESSIPDIKPLVSITPVSSSTCSLSMSKKSAGGIEIIPLGGSNEKDKSRELIRRSLSEDDKRRLEKKSMSSKKRKHLSSSRVSTGDGLSSSKKKLLDGKGKGKLDTVINRLQNPGPESSIELFPKGKEPTKVAPKSSSSLKLTIKAPNKFPSPSGKDPKPKSSSSSPSSKEKSSSKHSSSSSKSSSHRSHGSSSSSQGNRDRDRHQREREEVKKLLDGGKLNKTFQIPKLSKSSSPSTAKNPTTLLFQLKPQIYWRWECHTAQHQPQTPIFSAIECAAPSHHLAQYDAKGELQAVTSRRPPMEWEASHGTPQCAAHVPDPDKSSGLEGSGNAESLSSMSGPAKTAQGDGGDFVMTVRLVSTGK
ncbi:hypothetical protein TCAL_16126 [Tigriopus californicus]|uniref:Mediator of RNA polymerase II transcription subunit 1 n=1 Tax=Tigriopus californicus TaxID=6832 RepID=A0A553PNA1_TIGCA|nr:hypothetical protein TCAL_16126 [Tigriopus californicus]